MFTVIIVFIEMCVPSFVIISCCVGELHGLAHLVYSYIMKYGLRLFIVVLQELHCFNMTLQWLSWSSISAQSFIF